jgi:hypothetical protein
LLSQGRNHLRVVYDAQLKKMLAYIAVMITSFGAQLALLFVAVGRGASLLSIPVSYLEILAALLWGSQFCLVIAIATKFQELIILENELRIRRTYDQMMEYKFSLARLWDWVLRASFRIRGAEYQRMNVPFTAATIGLLIIITAVLYLVLLAL